MFDALITLILATALLLGAPGPAPLALAACGGVYGFRRGVPFLLGILTGLAIAIVLGAAGLAALFETYPASRRFLQVLGAAYIVYLAWKIASAPIVDSEKRLETRAPGFRDGLILNLLNPKVYAVFLALFSQFQLPMKSDLASLVTTGAVAYGVAIIVDILWLALGNALGNIFHDPVYAKRVRIALALLMVLAVLVTFAVPE